MWPLQESVMTHVCTSGKSEEFIQDLLVSEDFSYIIHPLPPPSTMKGFNCQNGNTTKSFRLFSTKSKHKLNDKLLFNLTIQTPLFSVSDSIRFFGNFFIFPDKFNRNIHCQTWEAWMMY